MGPVLSRRRVLFLSAAGAFGSLAGRHRLAAATLPVHLARAFDAVRDSMVVDMLGLLTLDYPKLAGWQLKPETYPDAEFQKLKASGVTVIHPAVGFLEKDAYASSWNDLTRWNMFVSAHPDKFLRILQPSDFTAAKKSGRIGVILGLQNSEHFRTLEDISAFYKLGQRVSQLTYTTNRLGGGSESPSYGLSAYGAQVVQRMNEVGMAVDLSHCSDQTTLDAIDASARPVLITHSNCRSLAPASLRCKTDEAIRRLAAKGGVFGVSMIRSFVRSSGPVTLDNVLDHIDHIARLAGIQSVGLGTDVDLEGRDRNHSLRNDLDGAQYPQKVFDIAAGLFKRGYSQQDVALVLGGNFQRVLQNILPPA